MMEDLLIHRLNEHAHQVQSFLSKMNVVLKSNSALKEIDPPKFLSSSEWQTYVTSLREEFKLWNETLLNAKDYFGDLPSNAKKKTWLDNIAQNQELKQIYESSFRNYVSEYRTLSIQQSSKLRQTLLKRDSELRLRGSITTSLNETPQKDRALHVAATATDTLKRMTQLMATELEKSMVNMATLDAQTKIVKDTHSEYRTMTQFLMGAKQRLSQLEQRERTDKILMYFGCIVFLCVVLYILKKRVFAYLFFQVIEKN